MNTKHRLTGKIIIICEFTTTAPLLIGKGKSLSEETDMDVMTDRTGLPYIPAAGFMGKLKSFMKKDGVALDDYYWGSDASKMNNNNSQQSHILLNKIVATNALKIKIRDGVKINENTRTAEQGAKYDYQIVEPGVKFIANFEITLRENRKDYEDVIKLIHKYIKHPLFRIGAYTNHGFGKLVIKSFDVYAFDFSDASKNHCELWFSYLGSVNEEKLYYNILNSKPSMDCQILKEINDNKYEYSIEKYTINLKLKNTFMLGGGDPDANDKTDKVNLKSGDKFVLTAKTLRGALRSRARFVCKNSKIPINLVDTLFGCAYRDTNSKQKGKLMIEETIFENAESFVQNRTSIDRFTGGSRKGKLFDSVPVFSNDILCIDFYVNKVGNNEVKQDERNLLQFVLKDLYTGKLAVAGEKNIGRGIFTGVSLYKNDSPIIEKEYENREVLI